MADFCRQCSIDMFGEDYHDLKNLCKKGFAASTICEGCGFIHVNENGECITVNCDKKHGNKK